MRLLAIDEVLELHRMAIEESGGAEGLRDAGGLESALAQPFMSFGGADLYPTLVDKVAAVCFSLVRNHPFMDGNKRIGHAVLETTLVLNGMELESPADEQETVFLALAAGSLKRNEFVDWVHTHAKPLSPGSSGTSSVN